MLWRALRRSSSWINTGIPVSSISQKDYLVSSVDSNDSVLNLLFASMSDGSISCVSSVCTHRPVIMSKAVRTGDSLRCHCHGAIFNLDSGAVQCAPATKPLRKFPVRIEPDQTISVDVEDRIDYEVVSNPPTEEVVCIIGAGAAGTACAEQLIADGFGGKINLITQEAVDAPYDRTLISKRFKTVPYSNVLEFSNVSFLNQTELLSIDAEANSIRIKTLTTWDDTKYGMKPYGSSWGMKPYGAPQCGPKKKWDFNTLNYTKLVIATGLKPEILFPGVSALSIYNSDDAAILTELVENKDLVVIGGGLLGLEAVSNLFKLKRSNKCKSAALIIQEEEPLGAIYGNRIGKVVRAELDRMEISIHSGTSATSAGRNFVELENGEKVGFDVLVNAVGTYSSIDYLPDTVTLGNKNKIVVTDNCCTTQEDIYAVGDCAEFERNDPHWSFAQETGKQAAKHIMGKKQIKIPETFVWSAIGGLNLRSVGVRLQQSHRTVVYENGNCHICLYLDDQENVGGVCTINADPICATLASLLQVQKVPLSDCTGERDILQISKFL